MKIHDGRKFTLEQKELIRLQAVSFVIKQGMTRVKASQILGVSEYSVRKWVKAYKKEGEEALKNKKHGRPQSTISKLKPNQCTSIIKIITDKTPDQLKFPFMLWTREAVGELIKQNYGINISIRTVGRYLKKWGFTPQRPVYSAFEKDPKAVTKFLQEEYPIIKKRAKDENAYIYWGDESGIRTDHTCGRSYGLKGKTPVVNKTGKRLRINMVSAVSNTGGMRFMVYKENMNVDIFLKFLNRLIYKNNKKTFLILDNLKVHKAYKIQEFIQKNKAKIELFFLPSYSPDLNPDELLNQDVKNNAFKIRLIKTQKQLNETLRSYLYSIQKSNKKVRNYFNKECVRFAR